MAGDAPAAFFPAPFEIIVYLHNCESKDEEDKFNIRVLRQCELTL